MAEEPPYNHHNNQNGGMEFEEEDGSSSAIPKEINQETQEALIQEAQDVKKFLEAFETEFNDPKNTSFYIISRKWLDKWKRFVSYDAVTKSLNPNEQFFGQAHPGRINYDLVDDDPRFVNTTDYPEDKSFTNVLLRDALQEGRDYQLISEAAWEHLYKEYEGIAIKRPVRTFPNGQRQVEVRLKKIHLVPVNNSFLKSVDHSKANDFKVVIFQAPSSRKLKEIRSDLVDICNSPIGKKWFETSSPVYYTYSLFVDDTIRFWKLDPEVTLEDMFKYVQAKCKRSTSYEYRIEFKGNYLLKDPEIPLEHAELADNDYMFLEVREQGRGWNFVGDGAPVVDKCECCNKYDELPIHCACNKVSYCSEECKFRDKRFHQMRCDKAGEEEEETNKQLSLTANSRKGLCGLQNLGNTCFMNSGLQCLSHVQTLTNYFLANKYLKEINETNPLGTKGKLVKKYAAFIKSLWFGGSTVYSPWALKHAISDFQPMFTGYQQHDSQELLAFLLDGLHEDLNRVKNKPFTETIESEGRPDEVVALKSWENYLKRNQSVVVDLMHGQFKSNITCPTCNRLSITFDPFNSISLPIPTKSEKEIDFLFVHANNRAKPVKVSIRFSTGSHTVAQLKAQTAELLHKDPTSFYFTLSGQHMKEVITDEAHTMTNTLRKKKKIRPLYAFEFAPEDLNANPEDRVDVDYQTSKKVLNYFGRPTRKKFTHIRTVCLRKNYTIRDIYFKLFQQYRLLWNEAQRDENKEEFAKLSDEEVFKRAWEDAEEKPFVIHLVTNARIFHECFFCGEKRCENCELKYDENMTVADLLAKIKDPDFKLEFEVYFDNVPEGLDLENLHTYDELSKMKEGEDYEKDKNINIYQCFEQFEEPEQLGEENAWYCSHCKEHKRATKKMEVYKAPPILMIHLKRFKSGNTSFLSKSKITAKVDFPLQDFNIGNYVINHEIPTDYDVERITPGYLAEETNGQTETVGDAATAAAEDGKMEEIIESKTSNTNDVEERKLEQEEDMTMNGKEEKIEEEIPVKSQSEKGKKELLYDLFAVVNHYGNLGFGHYTAYAKDEASAKWYCFDDSSVMEEDPDNVCTPASYVLFYKKKNWTPPF